jgi:hypothetical protein
MIMKLEDSWYNIIVLNSTGIRRLAVRMGLLLCQQDPTPKAPKKCLCLSPGWYLYAQ